MFDSIGKFAKILSYLNFIKAARWMQPSGSPEEGECAVMEFDVELTASTVASIGIVTAILRRMDPRVDTDHPVFQYMGRQHVEGQPSRLTFTISMGKTDKDGAG